MRDVIDILKDCGALLEGHFLLSSGKHSGGYCQCAKLMRFPALADEVLSRVAESVKDLGATKVCGPAMGGIVVAYELARQLNTQGMFTERKDGLMQLRRGFSISKGERVLIAEDVVTTGKSTMETVRALEGLGAEVVGVACIVDRREPGVTIDFPIYAALRREIMNYEPESCPLCKQGLELVKPGSREQLTKA